MIDQILLKVKIDGLTTHLVIISFNLDVRLI